MHAAISHQVDPEFLGLGLGSVLLNSLKQTVVTLASSAGVLSTVQSAAQAVLQSGWSVLLPTAEERARALSALLPCTGELSSGAEWRGEDRIWLLLCELEEKAHCRLVGEHSRGQTHQGVLSGQDPEPCEDMWEGNQVWQPGSQR